jgi:hypothetical protein
VWLHVAAGRTGSVSPAPVPVTSPYSDGTMTAASPHAPGTRQPWTRCPSRSPLLRPTGSLGARNRPLVPRRGAHHLFGTCTCQCIGVSEVCSGSSAEKGLKIRRRSVRQPALPAPGWWTIEADPASKIMFCLATNTNQIPVVVHAVYLTHVYLPLSALFPACSSTLFSSATDRHWRCKLDTSLHGDD